MDNATIDDNDIALDITSRLLGVERERLRVALCGHEKKFSAVDTIYVPYPKEKAVVNKNAFARHLYESLFSFVILKLNNALKASNFVFGTIGVLDIFGFEIFKSNSLEQFLINYANEKLQLYFNNYVFVMEQKEYEREGLPSLSLSYPDNLPCIQVLEQQPLGLIPLLHEEVAIPKGSDSNFLNKAHSAHKNTQAYSPPRMSSLSFTIHHYAGDVIYNALGFVEKNRDKVQEEMVNLVRESKKKFFSSLFSSSSSLSSSASSSSSSSSSSSHAPGSPRRGMVKSTTVSNISSRSKATVTLAGKFKVGISLSLSLSSWTILLSISLSLSYIFSLFLSLSLPRLSLTLLLSFNRNNYLTS